VGIIGASPGITGSARGQSQLRQAFEFTNSYAMPQPEILVFRAPEKFDDEGRLTDEATRNALARYLAAFEGWVRRLRI
jgi:chromate reductase